MKEPRHLNHAPLREALIDIRFDKLIALEKVRAFAAANASGYEKGKDIWQTSFGIRFDESQNSTAQSENIVVGLRLDSTSPPHVAQFLVNGFTFSRLHPYDSWQSLRDAGLGLWKLFSAQEGIETVTRIALRYINELKLPLPIRDFGDFLTVPPQVPANLPQGLSGFLQRVVIVNKPSNSTAIVTQALEDAPAPGYPPSATVVLDIDVFRTDQLGIPVANLPAVLEELHQFKNEIFFEYVTEKALEMFA